MKETRREQKWRRRDGGLTRPEPKWRPYTRKVLFRGPALEVVLCVWPPESASEFHDHGSSNGMVTVLKGIVTNHVYSKDGRFIIRQAFGEGCTFRETPEIIHRMFNISDDEPAVTMHVYSNPPLRMKRYKPSYFKNPT